jgi:hypothetical protein
MLNKVDFVWEAQRGGPRRKRKATVAPKATPIELLGPNYIRRQRIEHGGTMPGGLSLLGGVADFPFVNMGMNAAVMQAAAAAAAATATAPHWAMMGHGAFQASSHGSSPAVTGGPLGVFSNAMLFPMAQPQMPWAMASMMGFGGGTMPSCTGTPSTPPTTPVEPATSSAEASGTSKPEVPLHEGAQSDRTTLAANVDAVEAPFEATAATAGLPLPVGQSSAPVAVAAADSPPIS